MKIKKGSCRKVLTLQIIKFKYFTCNCPLKNAQTKETLSLSESGRAGPGRAHCFHPALRANITAVLFTVKKTTIADATEGDL